MKPRYQIKIPVDRDTLRAAAAKQGLTVPELVTAAAKRAARRPDHVRTQKPVARTTISLPAALAASINGRVLRETVERAAADIRAYGRFRVGIPLKAHSAPVARVELVARRRDVRLVRVAAVRLGTTLSRVVSAYLSAAPNGGEASRN